MITLTPVDIVSMFVGGCDTVIKKVGSTVPTWLGLIGAVQPGTTGLYTYSRLSVVVVSYKGHQLPYISGGDPEMRLQFPMVGAINAILEEKRF